MLMSKYVVCGPCAILVAAAGMCASASAQVNDWEYGRGGGYKQIANNTQPTVADAWFVEGSFFTDDPADVTAADIDGLFPFENSGDNEWYFGLVFPTKAALVAAYPINIAHALNITAPGFYGAQRDHEVKTPGAEILVQLEAITP